MWFENTGNVVIACFFRLAVVSMAGLAAEGLTYDKVIGQSADLFTLQVWDLYFQNMSILNYSVLFGQIIIIQNVYFPTEVYKQNQATNQQRSATKSHQMGGMFFYSNTTTEK